MNKRHNFLCWSCSKTYTLLRDISKPQTLTVACPYCRQEAVVEIQPQNLKQVMRGPGQGPDMEQELVLPEVLPTLPLPQKPE